MYVSAKKLKKLRKLEAEQKQAKKKNVNTVAKTRVRR